MATRRAVKPRPKVAKASAVRAPRVYSLAARTALLEATFGRMAAGESVTRIARDLGVNRNHLIGWTAETPELRERHRAAREAQGMAYGDAVVDLVQDLMSDPDPSSEHIQRVRLAVDSHKWLASKLFASVFGDRVQIDQRVTQLTVSLVQDGRVVFEQGGA